MRLMLQLIALCCASVSLIGCTTTPGTGTGPYQTPAEAMRNPLEAQRLTQEAVALLDSGGDLRQAEQLLRAALTADLYYGPAHNNLGVVYLTRNQLYEAANEFEWARKLMPGHPDPRMNLALVFEQAGRINDALATYETALEVYPNHLPTIQALTRCQLRFSKSDDRTIEHLRDIALRSATDEWRSWARTHLIRLGGQEG